MANTTWSTTDKTANLTLSGGNLTVTVAGLGNLAIRATDRQVSGKYYWEVLFTTVTNTATGIATGGVNLSVITINGANSVGAIIVNNGGGVFSNNITAGVSLPAVSNGSTVCIALDLDTSQIWFKVGAAGNWNGVAANNPATGVGGVSVPFVGGGAIAAYPLGVYTNATGSVHTANFGDSAFVGAVPSGFIAGFPATPLASNVLDSALVREALITTVPDLQLSALAREVLLGTATALTVGALAREILLVGDPVLTRPGQTAVAINMG